MVYDNDQSPYDIILGMDVMTALGIDVRSSTRAVTWIDQMIPFRSRNYFNSSNFSNILDQYSLLDPFDHCIDVLSVYSFPTTITIQPSLYESVNTDAVAHQQKNSYISAP
jgi:hypothetical protein